MLQQVLLFLDQPVYAQIIPYGKTSIRSSRDSSSASGCSRGACVISGAIKRGKNLFYLFREFDTRLYNEVTSILFRNKPKHRVWVGVGEGPAVIDKPLKLAFKSNFTLLSPYGVALLPRAKISNISWAGFVRAAGFEFLDGSFFIPDTLASPIIDQGARSPLASSIRLGETAAYANRDLSGSLSSEFPMVFINALKLKAGKRLTFTDASLDHSLIKIAGSSLVVPSKTDDRSVYLGEYSRSNHGKIDLFSDGLIDVSRASIRARNFYMQGAPRLESVIAKSKIFTSFSQIYNGNLAVLSSRLVSLGSVQAYGRDLLRLENALVSARPRLRRMVGNIIMKTTKAYGFFAFDKYSTIDVSGRSTSPDGGNIQLIPGSKSKPTQLSTALVGRASGRDGIDGSVFAYYISKKNLKKLDHVSEFLCQKNCEDGSVVDQVVRDIAGTDLAASALSDFVYSRPFGLRVESPQAINEILQEKDHIATARAISLLGLEQGIDYKNSKTPSLAEIQETLAAVGRQLVTEPRDEGGSQRYLAKERHEGARGSAEFKPAVLYLSISPGLSDSDRDTDFIDIVLVPCCAKPAAARAQVSRDRLRSLLSGLYRSVSSDDTSSGGIDYGKELYSLLFKPIESDLRASSIDTLLVFSDQSLQALPLGSLHDGSSFLGDRFVFSVSPSLALTNFPYVPIPSGRLLHLSSITFESLPPLWSVRGERSELSKMSQIRFVNDDKFGPRSLSIPFEDDSYSRVHVSTHADFSMGDPLRSVIYTGNGEFAFKDFRALRLKRLNNPLDLFALGACRTALGDSLSELGFAGLALQTGARTALGTQWYVDDLVTSAFFVQFYSLLDRGFSKLQAYRRVVRAFIRGEVRVEDGSIVGLNGQVLVRDLSSSQLERYRAGFARPYYWAGIQMIGLPW